MYRLVPLIILTTVTFLPFLDAYANCKSDFFVHLGKNLEEISSNFPKILIAQQNLNNLIEKAEIANSDFDPVLKSKSSSYFSGYYSGQYSELSVSKRNQLFGSQLEFGYKQANGSFPVYEDILRTADSGDFFSRLTIPLLQGLSVDKFRLASRLAKIEIEISDFRKTETEQLVYNDFLNYLIRAAEQRINLLIVNDLLGNLKKQKQIIQKKISLGVLPKNDILEIERFIIQAENQKLDIQNILQQTVNYLNQMYLTAEKLEPCRLPQKPNGSTIEQTLKFDFFELAYQTRPDLKILQALKKMSEQQIELQENNILPNLDLVVEYEKPYSDEEADLADDSVKGLLLLKFPFFNRAAESKLAIAENEIFKTNQQITLIENEINTNLFNKIENIKTKQRQYDILLKETKLLEQLLEADRKSYILGNLNLFQLNQRANILLKTKLKANSEYHKLLSDQILLFIYTSQNQLAVNTIKDAYLY